MGRATELFHFINQDVRNKDEEDLYCSLTVTKELVEFRKDVQAKKKARNQETEKKQNTLW